MVTSNNLGKEQAFRQLMKLPKETLVVNVSKTLRRYKGECDHLNEELNRSKEQCARLTTEINKKDATIAQLSVQRQREAAEARRLLAEAERKSTEMISKARRTLSKADKEARQRLEDAERQAEKLIQTKVREMEDEIQKLERKREDEKRRALSVYDGVAGQCNDLINMFSASLSQLRDAQREIDEKKEEIKREDFRTFDINKYIDGDDYITDISDFGVDGLDDFDSDMLGELLTGSPTKAYNGSSMSMPRDEKPRRAKTNSDYYTGYSNATAGSFGSDDTTDGDVDDLKSFTASFMKIEPPNENGSDFGLDLLDDLAPVSEERPRQSAASRWLN